MNISIPECKLLQNIPYNSFWDKINNIGTPVIEPLPDNDSHYRVTFLYQSTTPLRNVVLATYGLCSYDPLYDQLQNISGTDIYFKSYLLPRQTRTVYCFSPNDPLISIAQLDLYGGDNLPGLTQNWQADPFNKKSYVLPEWLVLGDKEKYFSLLELPGASDHSEWIKKQLGSTAGKISRHSLTSSYIDSSRIIDIYIPNCTVAKTYYYPLLIFFDGQAYLEYTSAASILDNLIHAKKIPPVIAVFISNPPPNIVSRWADYTCNEQYTNFIARELIPWVQTNFRASSNPVDNTVIGASLGGLAALFLGLNHANIVANIISQSGFFCWRPYSNADLKIEPENNWLIQQFVNSPKKNLRVYLDVGVLETALTFNKGSSILNSNRHMRDVLKAKGYEVYYSEYAGGHDYICWQNTLPNALLNFYGTPD